MTLDEMTTELAKILQLDPADDTVRREAFATNPPIHAAVSGCQKIVRSVVDSLTTLRDKDERIIELLQANNALIERTRTAEKQLEITQQQLDKFISAYADLCAKQMFNSLSASAEKFFNPEPQKDN
jgi:hypothetical protein